MNCSAPTLPFPRSFVSGAVWCDPAKYPRLQDLPCSWFDLLRRKDEKWQHALLEFRFFYEWDGISDCTIDFSGCCRFRLLINGVFVEDGPVEAGGDYGKTDAPNWWFGDSRKVTSWLTPGANEFRFQMLILPVVQSDYTTSCGWVWCRINDAAGTFTPEKWQFRLNPAYAPGVWQPEAENDSTWQNDCVPVEVRHQLFFMGLPPLTDRKLAGMEYLFPFGKSANLKISGSRVLVKPGAPAAFYLKLPRIAAGHLEVRTKGSCRVKMFFEFQELYGIKPDQPATEIFVNHPGESSFRTFRIYPCRYIKVDLIPSDFYTPSDCSETTVLEFSFRERAWNSGRKKRAANLPQPWLQQLDDRCLELLKLCMQRFHLDSPAHHEALGCTGDYRIGANIAALVYGETRLAKADLFRTAQLLRQQKKMFHTAYELCFVLMMQEFLEHSGDRDFVTLCYDALLTVFDHFKKMTGSEGLISQAENYLFIDWAVDGDVVYHHPPADRGTCAMTALWYGALTAMEKTALAIGKNMDAEKFRREAAAVRRAFNSHLWDEKVRAYTDGIPGLSQVPPNGWLPPENGTSVCTNIGNIMALAFGLPEKEQEPEKLLQRVISGEFPVKPSIYYMEYLLMAACRYQLPDREKLKILALWKPFLQDGIRESWVAGDYSHMWSAIPAYYLRKKDFFTPRKR